MRLPRSNATGVLLEEVREKLTAICRRGSLFSSRILKAGGYKHSPVTILSPPPGPVGSGVLISADQLAHSLTTGPKETLAGRIEKVVVVPECNLTRDFLLTHVFYPDDGLLGVYLYPRRFDEAVSVPAGGRLDQSFESPGLLGSALKEISASLTAGSGSTPLQFLVSASEVSAEEAQRMRDTDDYYSLRSPS